MMWIANIEFVNVLKTDKECLPTMHEVDTCIYPKPFNVRVSSWSSLQEGRSVGATVLDHPNSDIYVLATTIPANTWRGTISLYGSAKKIEYCVCMVVCVGLQANHLPAARLNKNTQIKKSTYCSAKAINHTVNANAPSNQFVMAVNMPHVIWPRGFIHLPFNCGLMVNQPAKWVNALHSWSDASPLYMYPVRVQKWDDKSQTSIWTVALVMTDESFEFLVSNVRILFG